jgi:hypothetical protein
MPRIEYDPTNEFNRLMEQQQAGTRRQSYYNQNNEFNRIVDRQQAGTRRRNPSTTQPRLLGV